MDMGRRAFSFHSTLACLENLVCAIAKGLVEPTEMMSRRIGKLLNGIGAMWQIQMIQALLT